MRLIDGDAEREGFMEMVYEQLSDDPDNIRANLIIDYYDNLPTVDAVPVVHAKWIAQNDGLTRFMCSHCKSENHEGFETYCPKCGAKMDLR